MKKILFLLLCTVSIYGQTSTGQEQSFPYGIVNESLQTITTPTYIGTFGTDGTQGKIPSALIAKTSDIADSLATKENIANKSDSYTTSSSTTYASTKALVDGLGTKIGGTLTSGYIPKATGANSLGNSLIYDNGTNVGIGTTSPGAKLDVNGDIYSRTGFGIYSNTFSPYSGNMTIALGGSGNSLIVSGGNVLIGTTTDNGVDKLQVNGSISATSFNGSATLTGTPTAPTAPVGTNTTQIATTAFVQATRPYKVYTALLSQTGTSAPTATVLENTLGGTVVWTRISTGLYNGTLTGIFTASKTVFFINQGNGASRLSGHRPDTNTVQVVSMNAYLDEFADNSINNASIEIRVYL